MVVGISVEHARNLTKSIRGIQRAQNLQELAQLYSEADVLINPTCEDNFPTISIEALACGTPVITCKTGGSPEAVDGKTGFVINQGDLTSMANTIMWMNDHPLSSEACRKRAEEYFDKDKCFEKYVELYEDLLK